MSKGPASTFHLAFTVTDLAAATVFYTEALGCVLGKTSNNWVILDFFGHKATAYLDRSRPAQGLVHDDDPDMRHFGAILPQEDFQRLAERLTTRGQNFMISPTHREGGTDNENWIMMLRDPAGNALEFNAVVHREKIFAPG